MTIGEFSIGESPIGASPDAGDAGVRRNIMALGVISGHTHVPSSRRMWLGEFPFLFAYRTHVGEFSSPCLAHWSLGDNRHSLTAGSMGFEFLQHHPHHIGEIYRLNYLRCGLGWADWRQVYSPLGIEAILAMYASFPFRLTQYLDLCFGKEKLSLFLSAIGAQRFLQVDCRLGQADRQALLLQVGVFAKHYQAVRHAIMRGDQIRTARAITSALLSEKRKMMALVNQFTVAIRHVEAVRNALLRGDEAEVVLGLIGQIASEVKAHQQLTGIMSGSVSQLHLIANKLIRGDEMRSILAMTNSVSDEIKAHLLVSNILSGHVHRLQSVQHSFIRGNTVDILQKIIGGIKEGVKRQQLSLNMLSGHIHGLQSIRESLARGDEAHNRLGIALAFAEDVKVRLLAANTLSGHISTLQQIHGALARGDEAVVVVGMINSLFEKISKYQATSNILSGSMEAMQRLQSSIAQGEPVEVKQQIIGSVLEEIKQHQALTGALSDSMKTLQSVFYRLSRSDDVALALNIRGEMTNEVHALQSIINLYTDAIHIFQKALQQVSGESVSAIQKQIMELLSHNDIYAYQKIVSLLAEAPAVYSHTPCEIYLDGRLVSGMSGNTSISFDEGYVHNEITIAGNDPDLFHRADPEIQYGEIRIEAQVGTRMIQFLLDSREGDETDYRIVGISVSAKEDNPYASDMDFHLGDAMGGGVLASELASSLTHFCPVEWEAADYMVDESWTFNGPPITGIMRLAAEVGAVVRCADDGSLRVRPKRPVRPVHMGTATADVSYDMSGMISLTHSEEAESGYNAVRVMGKTSEAVMPQLMLEPIDTGELDDEGNPKTRAPYQGEVCFVRAFWGGEENRIVDTYTTDGSISVMVGGAFYTDTIEALVEFENGSGRVSLPIDELLSVEWIGDSGGQVQAERHGTDLHIEGNLFRVARIRYRVRFQRYKLSGHNVERLLAVLYLETRPDVAVDVRSPVAPVYGNMIHAPFLSDDASAVARGKAWIDEQYRKSVCSLEAPYHDAAVDGNIAFINDAHIGEPGNYHITRSAIGIDGPKVTNIITVEKCLIFFNQ